MHRFLHYQFRHHQNFSREQRLCCFQRLDASEAKDNFNHNVTTIQGRQHVLEKELPMMVHAMEAMEDNVTDVTYKLYERIAREDDWKNLFEDPTLYTAGPVLDDTVVIDPEKDEELVKTLWVKIDWPERRDLLLEYFEDHLVGHTGSNEIQKLMTKLRDVDPAEDAFTKPENQKIIETLLKVRAYQTDPDETVTGTGLGGPTNTALMAEAVQALKDRYVPGGVPSALAYREIFNELERQHEDIEIPLGDLQNVDTFLDPMEVASLQGALKHTDLRDHYLEIYQLYLAKERERKEEEIEVGKTLQTLKEDMDLLRPSTLERVSQNISEWHWTGKLLAGAAAAYSLVFIWRSFQRVFGARDKNDTSWRIPSKLVVAITLIYGGSKLFKDTATGDALEKIKNAGVDGSKLVGTSLWNSTVGNILGKEYKIDTADDHTDKMKDGEALFKDHWWDGEQVIPLDDFYEYFDEQGEKTGLKDMAASLVIAQVPVSLLAKKYNLTDQSRGGKVNISGELHDEITRLSGRQPEGSVVVGHVEKNADQWGNALAHMFYLIGLHYGNTYENMQMHSSLIMPQLRDTRGDFDCITDPNARAEYDRIACEGLEIAQGLDLNLAQLIHAMAGEPLPDKRLPPSRAPRRRSGGRRAGRTPLHPPTSGTRPPSAPGRSPPAAGTPPPRSPRRPPSSSGGTPPPRTPRRPPII